LTSPSSSIQHLAVEKRHGRHGSVSYHCPPEFLANWREVPGAMTTTSPYVPLRCPAWCAAHGDDDADRLGGGVTTQHESHVHTWSDDEHNIAGIRRIDEYADSHLEGIFIADHTDALWDISAADARRLAAALLQLADQFESPASAPSVGAV
jgi:hypothetical protein